MAATIVQASMHNIKTNYNRTADRVVRGVLTVKDMIQLISSLVDCASTSTCLNIPQPVQLSRLGMNPPQPVLPV